MGLLAKNSGGINYDPVPQDMHHGICYSVVDLGTQQGEWKGNTIEQRQVLITFELPDCRIDIPDKNDENKTLNLPRAISKRYTLSLGEKANLRKDLESWRGQKFTEKELDGWDLKRLLGVNANVQVLHKVKEDKTYANIATITKLMKGVEGKDAENPLVFFSFDDGIETPEEVPEWVFNIIKESKEYKMIMGAASDNKTQSPIKPEDEYPEPEESDDLPF